MANENFRDGFEYQKFPFSFRLAQRGMLLSLSTLFFAGKVLGAKVFLGMRIVALTFVAVCFASGILATYYVVIRYPFLGLLDAKDGDLLARNLASTRTMRGLLRILNYLAILLFLILPLLQFAKIGIEIRSIVVLAYSVPMLLFLTFLAFRYERQANPTIATFIRASLGIGIVFFPLFLPALLIGGLRCRLLLNSADEIEANDRLKGRQ